MAFEARQGGKAGTCATLADRNRDSDSTRHRVGVSQVEGGRRVSAPQTHPKRRQEVPEAPVS